MKSKDSPYEQDYWNTFYKKWTIDIPSQFCISINKFTEEKSQLELDYIEASEELRVLKGEKDQYLSSSQKAGIFFFKFLVWPFTSPVKFQKLKNKPKEFFRDSKNSFTRSVGLILRLL